MKNHPETDHCGFDRNASISEDCYVCTCGYVDRETPNPRPSQLTEQVRGAIAAGPALLPPTHPEAIKYGKKRETAKEFAERVALLARELCDLALKGLDTRLPEVAELIEALRPLAMLGGPDDGCAAAFHDIEDDTLVYENSGKCITAGDVRAARKLVSRYAQPIATAERRRSPLAEYCNACKKTVAKPCMLVEECPHYAGGDMNSSIMERK